jgi:Ca-activated chloride channel family protein
MLFNPEDPKWTAYVLNELSPGERADVERELAASPEASKLVEALRGTTQLLARQLTAEPVLALTAEQRQAIGQQVVLPATPRRRWFKSATTWVAAASVLFVLGTLLLPATQHAREAARRTNSSGSQFSNEGIDYDQSQAMPSIEVGGQLGDGMGGGGIGGGHHGIVNKRIGHRGPQQDFETKSKDLCYTVVKPVYETERLGKGDARAASDTFNGQLVGGRGLPSTSEPVNRNFVGSTTVAGPKSNSDGYEVTNGLSKRLASIETTPHFAAPSGGEAYETVTDNAFLPARQIPLSTFSIDVDTASYSNMRRFLTQNGTLPPPDAVRIEELVNYFRYDYPQPDGDVPFSVTTEVAGCPWNAEHRLVRIGLKGREIETDKRPASNLVFLLDVSGSMSDANKLPLVREAMKLLAEQLTENDRISIVVYASSTGCVLEPTTGNNQREIREAIDRLQSGGSTNGSGGIQQAYEMASRNFIKDGINRVILATDGDFNVGVTNRDELVKLITEQAKSGVFLTTLGFGMGNLKDATLEQLANKGNGNYAYIDDMREAKKVFVEQLNGTLVTIAKDVKIQIEFNPAEVASYRLIGYENRILAAEDFNDDKKDAGEIGAGHTVTALYEIVPADAAAHAEAQPAVDPLKYQPQPAAETQPAKLGDGELLTLKLRYKQPDGDTSKLIETVVRDSHQPYGKATADFKFASSVALFGMILRNSPHKGTGTIDAAEELAREGLSKDDGGYRTEFVELIERAKQLGAR